MAKPKLTQAQAIVIAALISIPAAFISGYYLLQAAATPFNLAETATARAVQSTNRNSTLDLTSQPPQIQRLSPVQESPTVPESGVTKVETILPTITLLSKLKNIWNLASPQYTSLYSPGTNVYSVTIEADQTFYLGSHWCTKDQELLYSNLKSLSFQYLIDNNQVPETEILQDNNIITGQQYDYCHVWSISIQLIGNQVPRSLWTPYISFQI